MIRGPVIHGSFPRAWIQAAEDVAIARTRSNSGRSEASDRGAAVNLAGDLVGMIGERIAQEHRPDLGIQSKRLHASGRDAPKTDSPSGIDVKSSPMGRPRVLVNCRQAAASSLVGVVVVLVDQDRAAFWMSPVIDSSEILTWPIFDGPYNAPAHYVMQAALVARYTPTGIPR